MKPKSYKQTDKPRARRVYGTKKTRYSLIAFVMLIFVSLLGGSYFVRYYYVEKFLFHCSERNIIEYEKVQYSPSYRGITAELTHPRLKFKQGDLKCNKLILTSSIFDFSHYSIQWVGDVDCICNNSLPFKLLKLRSSADSQMNIKINTLNEGIASFDQLNINAVSFSIKDLEIFLNEALEQPLISSAVVFIAVHSNALDELSVRNWKLSTENEGATIRNNMILAKSIVLSGIKGINELSLPFIHNDVYRFCTKLHKFECQNTSQKIKLRILSDLLDIDYSLSRVPTDSTRQHVTYKFINNFHDELIKDFWHFATSSYICRSLFYDTVLGVCSNRCFNHWVEFLHIAPKHVNDFNPLECLNHLAISYDGIHEYHDQKLINIDCHLAKIDFLAPSGTTYIQAPLVECNYKINASYLGVYNESPKDMMLDVNIYNYEHLIPKLITYFNGLNKAIYLLYNLNLSTKLLESTNNELISFFQRIAHTDLNSKDLHIKLRLDNKALTINDIPYPIEQFAAQLFATFHEKYIFVL